MSVVAEGAWGLVLGWTALVIVAGAWRAPPRMLALPPSSHRRGATGPLATLGATVRRVVTRASDRTPNEGDGLLGAGLLATVLLVVVHPPTAPLPLAAALVATRLRARRAQVVARHEVADALPDVADLLALAVGSGLPVGVALGLVGAHTGAPLGADLVAADARLRHGASVVDALAPLAERTPVARPLVGLLAAAHVDGAPVVDALGRMADELRADRRRAVEARARQVPVRMLFPLVLCTLPAFVLLTIVPPIVAALGDLRT